ncbi:MAG: STAS domain-containing protein [Gaiellales bacterium]
MASQDLLTVAVSRSGTRAVIRCAGEIDLSNRGRIEEVLAAACDPGVEQLALDLSQVTFMDSSGVKLLLDADRRCTERRIRFGVTPSAAVQRVLDMVRVSFEALPSGAD